MILKEKYCFSAPIYIGGFDMAFENLVLAFSYLLLASYYLLLAFKLLLA